MEEVMAQVFIFFIGGYDTSSIATSFALFELAKNKIVLQKVQEDIDNALRKHNNEWTYDCIQDMKYLEQVFEEALRIYPSVPFLMRQTTRDYTIPGTKFTVEKGTAIQINTLALHRDPDNFPNPMKFDPDRFSPETRASIAPYTYLPFGDGPRNCIGMRYGQLQSKIGLASILSKFNVDLASSRSSNMEYSKTKFLSAEGGVELKFSLRSDI